jgi:CDP-4-dehydro-6-deoxyglucose reductase, E3
MVSSSLQKHLAQVIEWKPLLPRKLYQLTLLLETGAFSALMPGQYIEIQMPNGAYKAFYPANAPRKRGTIICYVRALEDIEALTAYQDTFTKRMQPGGGQLYVRGPCGLCTFAHFPIDTPIILVAGGSSHIAPIKALIEHILMVNDQRHWHVFWGAQQFSSLFLHEQMLAWQALLPNLTYTPIVLHQDGANDCEQGLVHQVVIRHYPDLAHHFAYLSGTSSMVYAARALYQQHGMHSRAIMADILVNDQRAQEQRAQEQRAQEQRAQDQQAQDQQAQEQDETV